uniref:Uncharacterized protein n=1 Tax=Glossina austeni TaxID=7395 RepID=A0A1A9VEG8_GLOAU
MKVGQKNRPIPKTACVAKRDLTMKHPTQEGTGNTKQAIAISDDSRLSQITSKEGFEGIEVFTYFKRDLTMQRPTQQGIVNTEKAIATSGYSHLFRRVELHSMTFSTRFALDMSRVSVTHK